MTDTDRPTILRLRAKVERLSRALALCVAAPFLMSLLLCRWPTANWASFATTCLVVSVAFIHWAREGQYR